MKMRNSIRIDFMATFLLLTSLLFTSCDSQNPLGLTDEDRAYFGQKYAEIGKSWNEGDRNPYLDRYKDNTVYMVPHQELISDKKAIQAFVYAFPELNAEFTVAEIWGNATFVNVRGIYSVTDRDGNLVDKGKFISLWQNDGDANWKITHDIWNSDIALNTPNPIE